MALKYNQLISLTSGGQSGQHAKNDCMEVPTALSRCIRSDVIKIKKRLHCTGKKMCLAATMDYRPFIIMLPRSEVATYLYDCALHFADH